MKSPTIAVSLEGDRQVVLTIPAETIVEIGSETIDDNQVVNALWKDMKIMMFLKDVLLGDKIH